MIGTTIGRHRVAGRPGARRGLRGGLLAVSIVVAAGIAVRLVDPAGWWKPAADYGSIAVLPLLSGDGVSPDDDYLVEGIADEIANRLTRIRDLRVAPWVTSRRYPVGSLPYPDLCGELGVETLLVGTVTRPAGSMELALEMIDGETGAPVWTETFGMSRGELPRVAELVASAVGRRIRGGLSAAEEEALARGPTADAEAYDLYLRGTSLLRSGTREEGERALAHFENAIELDPRLAAAWVGAGAANVQRYYYGWEGGGEEGLRRAEESFLVALDVDPASLAAQRGLVHVHWNRGTLEECLRIGQRIRDAHLGDVSVEALMAQADAYFLGGLPGEAVHFLRTVIRTDPVNLEAHWMLVVASAWSRDYQSGLDLGSRFLREFGEDPEVYEVMGWCHASLGALEDARLHFDRALELFGEEPNDGVCFWAAALYRRLGLRTTGDAILGKGISVLERRLETAPDNRRIRRALMGHRELLAPGTLEMRDEDLPALFAGNSWELVAAAWTANDDHRRAADLMVRALEAGTTESWLFAFYLDVLGVDQGHPAYVSLRERMSRTRERLLRLYAG